MSNFTNFTDEELNRNWTPSGRRPQSTIAQSFSAELENLFRIDNSAVDLDNQVDKRRRVVSLQTEELEALEARLREIQNLEARIRGDDVSASSSAASSASGSPTTATAAAKAAQNQRDGSM